MRHESTVCNKRLNRRFRGFESHWSDLPLNRNVLSKQCLKTVDTIGNCQRLVFSLCVSKHMHKITNLWKFELNWSSKLRDMNEIKKTPLSHEVVCFHMLDFETSNSKLEVSKSKSWKITFFLKTTSLQREPFLTIFYTINLSPLYSLPSEVLCW